MYNVQFIRRANPIAHVIIASGVELRRLGRRLVGRCPFHTDAQPSLVVYPEDASYFCFGCSAGGDVIDFISRLNRVGFREAISLLTGASIESPRCGDARIAGIRSGFRTNPPTDAEVRVIDAAAAFYHESLWCSPGALAYLALRGIDRQTAKKHRVGYGCPGLAPHLRRRGRRLDDASAVGLLNGRRETMVGRVIVPDIGDGRAIWLTGRSLGEGSPRYMNLRLPTPIFGFASIRDHQSVIVAEGVFDWLTLVQWEFPAVALLGTRIPRHTVDALRRFGCVYIALDSDDAGRRASAELASALGSRAVIVALPSGVQDVNDLGRSSSGRQAFERCLELATDGKEDQWERTNQPGKQQAA
jgi:DNA primase